MLLVVNAKCMCSLIVGFVSITHSNFVKKTALAVLSSTQYEISNIFHAHITKSTNPLKKKNKKPIPTLIYTLLIVNY